MGDVIMRRDTTTVYEVYDYGLVGEFEKLKEARAALKRAKEAYGMGSIVKRTEEVTRLQWSSVIQS